MMNKVIFTIARSFFPIENHFFVAEDVCGKNPVACVSDKNPFAFDIGEH